jgi:GrpB-like predicted nucleotidyltransferase (UPF0157 family)
MMSSHPVATAFDQERARLLAALGQITAGGLIESSAHIGSTSVPGLRAAPCVDIGLAVWPFPLEPARQQSLVALGYELLSGDDRSEQRFCHQSGGFQLFIVASGSDRWSEYLLIRDYLRDSATARLEWDADVERSAPKAERLERILADARPWWINCHGFESVEAIARELKSVGCAWYISSGWALDLFLGQVTRVHHDVDVAIARTDQLTLQQYLSERGWQWLTPFEQRLEPWPPHLQLALPRHQAHAHRDDAFIDFLLTDIGSDVWRYRRDPMVIRNAARMSLLTEKGIPYLAPELVLLFKSKNTSNQARQKDQTDFERVYTHLEPERRAWLRWALIAAAPDHPWLQVLA